MFRAASGASAATGDRPGAVRRLWWGLLRRLFQLVLRAPKPWLLRLCRAPEDATTEGALDHRARFHGWLVRRFGGRGPEDHLQARKPQLLSLGLLEGPALDMARCTDMQIPGPGGALPARLYVPHGATTPAPVLVFFHFGGGVLGDLDTSHTACSYFAHHGRCIVLSVGYRLAPEHKFPAALKDAIAAVEWAREAAGTFGGDATRVGIGGDSAGGHLAAAASLALCQAGAQPPALQLLIYPVLEMDRSRIAPSPHDTCYPLTRQDMVWFSSLYLRRPEDAEQPLCSVARAPSLAGLPPVLFVQAGHDVLYAEGAAFLHRLQAAGVPTTRLVYRTLPHAFTAMSGGLPAARAALIEIAERLGQSFDALPAPSPTRKESLND